MVKFQKQFEGQLAPEWKEAYCNYKQLKKEVKRIKEHYELADANIESGDKISFNSLDSILKSLGSLLVAFSSRLPRFLSNEEHITVHLRQLGAPGDDEEFYETEVLSALIPMQLETDFFRSLDAQLNMVNRFYKLKEEEYTLRARSLQLQMAAFLDSRRQTDGCKSSCRKLHRGVASASDSSEDDKEAGPKKNSTEWPELQHFDRHLKKDKLSQCDEKGLRAAFIEFYRGLSMLKSFSALNKMAFAKILKKYDKVTGWNASLTYLRVVESSYFAGSDEMIQLMDRVEDLFTQHLADQNYRQAMVYLKPVEHTSSKLLTTSYLQGLCSGCALALLATLALTLLLPSSRWTPIDGRAADGALVALFPASSTVGLVLLHLYIFGWNLYLWRQARINYAYLFEWPPRTDVQCHDILRLTTVLTSMWLLLLVVLKLYPNLPYGDHLPVTVLIAFSVVLILPFNVFYRPTRMLFLRCIFQVISAPFHKVGLAEFFLADQLCSQAGTLKDLQYLLCYYIGSYFHKQEADACTNGVTYHIFAYFVCIMPFWWRLMQCVRRWMDERDLNHLINGGKYLSAMVASLLKVAYMQQANASLIWISLFIMSAILSTVYNLYWDIVMDWGFMQPKSVNTWLRDRLTIKRKWIYYFSMVLNFFLRLVWLGSLLHMPSAVDREVTDVLLAGLEVFRRGLWNFFRLEYEHVSNLSKARAIKLARFQDLEFQGTPLSLKL